MTTSVSWPTSLPDPVQPFKMTPKPSLIRSDMEQGAARQRKRFTAKMTEAAVAWVFAPWEFMIFDSWITEEANDGATWFSIPLQGSTGWTAHEARVKGELDYDHLGGGTWKVTGSLEIRQRPMLSAASLALLVDEDPDEFEAAMLSIHETLMSLGSP